MVPFSNKRRHRRFTVDVMEIEGSAVFAREVVIRDISVTGASLITERKLDIGREYALRIMDGNLDITLQGTVIWCSGYDTAARQSEEAHLKYSAGLQFTDLQQETLAGLIKFIESHLIGKHTEVKDHQVSGQRCNIRFHIDRTETAVLNVSETYQVKTLSLGGLLIESDHGFEPETRLHMDITIPGNAPLSFTGRVASSTPSPDDPHHVEIGIEFVDMREQDRTRLKEFIRRLYLEDAGFTA
jgi:Tfp pilus assembly protein PilZ